MVMAISFMASAKLVMSVRSTRTRLPWRANCSATARLVSGTSRHSTTGSEAVCTNMTLRERAPLASSVSRK